MGILDGLGKMVQGARSYSATLVPHYIAIKSEQVFQGICLELAQEITPQQLDSFAQQDISLNTIIQDLGKEVPAHEDNPGVEYLQNCSYNHLLGLLQLVIPEHGQVLARYPRYAIKLIDEFKILAKTVNIANSAD